MATTCSASSIRGLPPNLSLNFLLSSRAVPLATTKTTCSPTRRHIVLAICAGSTPWAAAASDTVAELASVSITVKSGARSARKLRTLSRTHRINIARRVHTGPALNTTVTLAPLAGNSFWRSTTFGAAASTTERLCRDQRLDPIGDELDRQGREDYAKQPRQDRATCVAKNAVNALCQNEYDVR